MIWKIIPNFTSYEASSDGEIRERQTKKVLEKLFSFNNPENYYFVRIKKDGSFAKTVAKTVYLHRLVCMAFHGEKDRNEDGKRYVVDHIDGNKHNNKASNLRWVTHSENMILAMKNKLRDDNIEMTIHDTVLNKKTTYYSIIEASRALNIDRGKIYSCLYLFSGKKLFMNRYRLSYNKEKLGAVIRKSRPCWIYDLITNKWSKYGSVVEATLNTGLLPSTIQSKLNKNSHESFCGYIVSNTKLTKIPNYSRSEAMNERKNIYRYSTNPITVYLVYDKVTNESLVARTLKEACEFANIKGRKILQYKDLKSKFGTTKPWIAIDKIIL